MNFLQLVQRVRQEAGASGADTTTVGAQGEWKRLVDWTSTAWVEIQEAEPNWNFMRGQVSFITSPGVRFYPPGIPPVALTDFRRWLPETFRVILNPQQPSTEMFLSVMPFAVFRDTFLFGAFREQRGAPVAISINPADNALALGPLPIGTHNINGGYYRAPQVLLSDTDTPIIPPYYRMIIVYRALQLYGLYEAAQEVVMRADREYRIMLDRLRHDQTQPSMTHRRFL